MKKLMAFFFLLVFLVSSGCDNPSADISTSGSSGNTEYKLAGNENATSEAIEHELSKIEDTEYVSKPAGSQEDEDEYYYPSKEKTVISDTLIFGGAEDSIREALPLANLKESYVFIKSLNCEDRFYWDYEVYIPRFIDEIEYDGAEKIKTYYAEMALDEERYIEQFVERGFGDSRIPKSITNYDGSPYYTTYYTYQNYAVDFVAPYLAVTFGGYAYLGGAHGFDSERCDNFDMRSGQKLALEDVLDNMQGNAGFLNSFLNDALTEMFGEYHTEVDVLEWYDEKEGFSHPFRLTNEGLQIIFQPYETGPYSYGMPKITIPYHQIESFLKIEIAN